MDAGALRRWNLAGTTARKGTPTAERPHREVRLIEAEAWHAEQAATNSAALPRLLARWQWLADYRAGRAGLAPLPTAAEVHAELQAPVADTATEPVNRLTEADAPPTPAAHAGPCTVAALAAAKKLPEAWLREECALHDLDHLEHGGVGIPYLDATGQPLVTKRRTHVVAKEGSRWPAGVPLAAYGLWRLDRARKAGHLYLHEGESNAWAFWHAGLPSLGLPGSGTVRATLTAECVEAIQAIYICEDPDAGGAQFVTGVVKRLIELSWHGRAWRLRMPDGLKDAADLWVRDPDVPRFAAALEAAVTAAESLEAAAATDRNGKHAPATPLVPPKETRRDQVATIDDLIAAGREVAWIWPGWIPSGVLTAIAAPGGIGKTRLCADLVRRIKHRLPWPDGQTITLPPDAKVLWIVSDNHHDEMVTLAQNFDIKDAIYINATKLDPYCGVTLEDLDDYRDLEGRIAAVKPAFVIVDTVGNATDKNLSRQEDAKAFYFPLQVLARRHRCAILCLTHLNAGGAFLGRRVLEKVRVALRMEQPDETCERRRLEVHKSNSKRPEALGLTMGDAGNEYDDNPPARAIEEGSPAPGGRRRPRGVPPKVRECADWLKDHLSSGPNRVSITRTKAEAAGFKPATLYAAKELLQASEFEAEGRKWWTLAPDNDDVIT